MCDVMNENDVKDYLDEDDDYIDEEERKKDREYNDMLRNLGLEDNEIDEVKKGNQSEYDFIDDPDEDFEDDDYYGEDDI